MGLLEYDVEMPRSLLSSSIFCHIIFWEGERGREGEREIERERERERERGSYEEEGVILPTSLSLCLFVDTCDSNSLSRP